MHFFFLKKEFIQKSKTEFKGTLATHLELANKQYNRVGSILSQMNTLTLPPHGLGELLLILQDPAQDSSPPLESLPYLHIPRPIRCSLLLSTPNILSMSLHTTFINSFAASIFAYLFS